MERIPCSEIYWFAWMMHRGGLQIARCFIPGDDAFGEFYGVRVRFCEEVWEHNFFSGSNRDGCWDEWHGRLKAWNRRVGKKWNAREAFDELLSIMEKWVAKDNQERWKSEA